MKSFFKKHSYSMVKLFITQLVIGLFGNIIALAGVKSESKTFTLITSIFAILFYAFLVYTYVWEIGSRDKPAIDAGREKLSGFTGLFIGLGAHIPGYILALVYAVLLPTASTVEGTVSSICGLSKIVLLFVNGMYTGLMSVIELAGQPLHNHWFSYFIITIPALLVSLIGYLNGAKDIHFTKLLLPVTPEEQEMKREKSRKNKR